MTDTPLAIDRDGRGVATVTLNRPDVRNAFDAELIAGLRDTFENLAGSDGVRAVVLTGAGRGFCAGADLNWMKGMVDATYEENLADSRKFEAMLRAVHDCPVPTVAKVNGHAFGGGAGLIGCVDVAVAVRGAKIGFTEVRLGLAPAVIAPYVLPKIGIGNARHYFLTGDRFDADTAERMGLVNRTVEPDQLDGVAAEIVEHLLACGPHAQREVKSLLADISVEDPAGAADRTTETIARLRVSEEGQEGMNAFFDKREPSWRRKP